MMYRHLLLIVSLCLIFISTSFSQDNRTIDGTFNNLENPFLGAVHEPMLRLSTNDFADGISSPGGVDRLNPRKISNRIFAQLDNFNDPLGLSDYIWVFGQFIDHDLTLVEDSPTEPAMIPVNFHDVHFNPGGALPFVMIPMMRSAPYAESGTSTENPRNYGNGITHWLDGSGVYGSDIDRANWLRSFVDGKLKVSSGNLLPFNTITGEYDDPVDENAPFMADDVGFAPRLFVAGDVRANEQPLLIAFHTLFVREHNRLCDELKSDNPDWSDEELYQYARKMVSGYIQSITYEEWLPTMGVHIPEYTAYDATVDGSILNVFSAAAFRMGHTLLNSQIVRMDNEGNVLPGGNLTLLNGFFNPTLILDDGLDPYFKGMGTQIQQDMDGKVIDDVRNFLFGPPGAGGLDLAAININRGRERGLPDFNQIRAEFGLSPYMFFPELHSDPMTFMELQDIYGGDINNIDPWVGMLTEEHMPGALFGETVMEIMKVQFQRLRDGDRYYYENDPVLTAEEKERIKNTRLHDVIMRNTDISLMQYNVFEAMPHDSIGCGASSPYATVSGSIKTAIGDHVESVDIDIEGALLPLSSSATSSPTGYALEDIPTCGFYTVTPYKNDGHQLGLSAIDILLMQKHALGLELLDSPYKVLAADVNNSNSITAIDISIMRKMVLFIDTEFEDNTSWRFIDANYEFENPYQPWLDDYPESIDINGLTQNTEADFVAVKIGDVNGSFIPSNILGSTTRDLAGTLLFQVDDQELVAGEEYQVHFSAKDFEDILTYQFTLNYDLGLLEYVSVNSESLNDFDEHTNFGLFPERGVITTMWNGELKEDAKEEIFTITFRAKRNGSLKDALSINSKMTKAEAYNLDYDPMHVALEFNGQEHTTDVLTLYQNKPNPFNNQTLISFEIPDASEVNFSVYDVSGRILMQKNQSFSKGYNEIIIDSNELSASGILYYQLETAYGTAIKKMVMIGQETRP